MQGTPRPSAKHIRIWPALLGHLAKIHQINHTLNRWEQWESLPGQFNLYSPSCPHQAGKQCQTWAQIRGKIKRKILLTLFREIKCMFLNWFCTALWVLMGPAHLIRAKTALHLNKIPSPLLSSLNVNLKQRDRNHRGDYGPKCCFRDSICLPQLTTLHGNQTPITQLARQHSDKTTVFYKFPKSKPQASKFIPVTACVCPATESRDSKHIYCASHNAALCSSQQLVEGTPDLLFQILLLKTIHTTLVFSSSSFSFFY